jgi:hypothetical protein
MILMILDTQRKCWRKSSARTQSSSLPWREVNTLMAQSLSLPWRKFSTLMAQCEYVFLSGDCT